ERFQVPFREDSDLHFRVAATGASLVADDTIRVIHPAPEGPFAVSLRLQRYAMFNALMYRKHPRRYRAELQRRPPLLYYAIVLCTIVAAISLIRRSFRAALAGGGAAIALDLLLLAR